MRYGDRTKEQLSNELKGLKQRILELEKIETEHNKAEDALRLWAKELKAINEMGIELATMSCEEDIYELICDRLKSITGALLTSAMSYDPKKQKLKIEHIRADSKFITKASEILGKKVKELQFTLETHFTEWMVSQRVKKLEGLHELTFGTIEKTTAHLLERVLGIGDVYGLALHHAGKFMGTVAVLMPRQQPLLSLQILEVFSHLVAVSLQRRKDGELLKESEEYTRIFASYQHAISELRKFYGIESSFEQMLQKTVDLFVKNFGYYMAWYGELKVDEKVIIPKVWAGKYEKYLSGLRLDLDDSKDAKCAMSLAIVRKEPFGYADLEHDKDFEKWRPVALKYGYRSNQAIPLIVGGKSIGAFLIYSTHPLAFSQNLIRHLEGITDELATIVEKITERKKIEEELSKYREHLEEMIEVRTTELKTINEQLQREIAERKKIEEKLRGSEKQYRVLVQTIPDIIYEVDANGIFTFISDAINQLGHTPEELIGKHFREIVYPDDFEVISRSGVLPKYKGKITGDAGSPKLFDERRTAGRMTKNLEVRLLLKNQEGAPINYRYFEVHSSGKWDRDVHEKDKKLLGSTGIVRDITERKKAEEALRESEEKYRDLLDNVNDLIQSVAPDTSLIYVNRAWRESLGYSEEEIPELSLFNVIHPDSHAHCMEIFKRLMTGERVERFEAMFLTKDGRMIVVEGSANCRFVEGKPVATRAIFRDITERKKAEEELKRAYKELEDRQQELIQSEKSAVVGQLATGMAHEINNPLFVISGESEMLLKDEDRDRNTRDSLKVILEQSKRIKVIIERVLEFSRKREFEQKPLDVNDALEKSISLLSYQIKTEDIKITKELDLNLPKVLGDTNQIQEVFLNIMLNAVQAMEREGELTLRTRREKVTKNGSRRTDKFKLGMELVVIEFKDTGKGMDEQTRMKIFDPFFTTKEKNTGLGLSICYRIIENHSGIIEAHSKLEEGSTFTVKLPGGG